MLHKYLECVLAAQNWLKQPGIVVRETGDIAAPKRRKLIEMKGACCKHCGKRADLTVDHRVARSLGGTNEKGNIQVLCCQCNREKNGWEIEVRQLLGTPEGRGELLRRLQVTRELAALKGRIKNAHRQQQRQLAYLTLHGKPEPVSAKIKGVARRAAAQVPAVA